MEIYGAMIGPANLRLENRPVPRSRDDRTIQQVAIVGAWRAGTGRAGTLRHSDRSRSAQCGEPDRSNVGQQRVTTGAAWVAGRFSVDSKIC
jgi:hypothetical protein